MKAFFAILFSSFFLLSTMQQTTIYLLYKLNERSITEHYCINKNIPGSCCHGKCHLNKTIARSESDNTNGAASSLNIKVKEVEVICQQLEKDNPLTTPVFLSSTLIYTPVLSDGHHASLIKPPAVLG